MNTECESKTGVAVASATVTKKLLDGFLPLLQGEDVIIIHSALSKLGFPKNDLYLPGVLDFLTVLLDQGKTLLLPSFTFSFSKRKQYAYTDPSETGALADLARNELNFARTNNPMFSFTLAGPKKDIFLAGRSHSGYGEGTAVARLNSADVAVVMLGAEWSCCTVIHAMEEKAQVPYRSYVNWNYPVDFGNGEQPHAFTAFVRNDKYNTGLNFGRIREVLQKKEKLRQSKINDIIIEAANGKTIADLANENILQDPFYFVSLEKE